MNDEEKSRIGIIAGGAFHPGSSIKTKDVFAGRQGQIRSVIDAITQDGRSALIYGERGVGKTSLANVIYEFFLSAVKTRIFAPHIACDSEDSFDSVWTKVFTEKDTNKPRAQLSDSISDQVDGVLNSAGGKLTPHHIKQVADIITQTHLMVPIIDEFDRIEDENAIRLFTDTIKYLSDHTRSTTVILVGVGDTVDDLISEHHSIERSLAQVLMPRMKAAEALDILKHGEATTGVKFSPDASSLIVSLAQGLPHYTHLLGLNSTRAAVDTASWTVREQHVESAIKEAVSGSQQSLLRAYHSATMSPRPDHLYRQVLLACALAEVDELGYFAAADVRGPMTRIMKKPYDIPSFAQHLKAFCEPDRGEILQRHGPDRGIRYRFTNPLIQPFIIMSGIKEGYIGKEDVRGLFRLGPDYSNS